MEFEAWFSARTAPDRSWTVDESTWRFRYRYLPVVSIGPLQIAAPVRLLMDGRIDVLVSLYGSLAYVVGIGLARARGIKRVIWAEVTFDSWNRRRVHKEWLKRVICNSVEGVLIPGDDGRRYIRRYGVEDDKVHLVQNVVDGPYFAGHGVKRAEISASARDEFQVTGVVFAYVGRLWRPKGLFDLLEAYRIVCERLQNCSLLIIGDGTDEQAARQFVVDRGLRNVRFGGFQPYEALPRCYAAADVFVFPTLGDPYGLVVDEAMASGLPVISTTAAGEIAQRVRPGLSGVLVPPSRPDRLAAAMMELATDRRLRERMGANAMQEMSQRGPSQWAMQFEQAVRDVLG